jgi:hypothetical protein
MKLERFLPDTRTASRAISDSAVLLEMQDAIKRAVARGVLEAYRNARELQLLDSDKVMAEVETYFGPDGAWKDLLTDAFWDFDIRSQQEEAHWSEAGR